MAEIKLLTLSADSNVISNTNTMYHTGLRKFMSLWFKFHEANEVTTNGVNPDRPISNEGIKIDEDLILVASWTYGFGIHRVADDGTVSNVYADTYPHNSYQYMNSIAIDKINKIAAVGSYGSNGVTFYDYSDCFDGTDTVTKLDTWNSSNSALTYDEPGMSYVNGLGCAGEWFYGTWDEGITTVVQRWKYHDDDYGATDFESITIQNRDGSAHRDGMIREDPDNDRIFIKSYYDGELVVVTDASSDTLTRAFHIHYDDLTGVDNDGYIHGVVVDKDNSNHLWCGSGYQLFKMDITDCVVDGGTDPIPDLLGTVIQRESGDYSMMTFGNMRISSPINNNSTWVKLDASNGWNRRGGWVDTENFVAINIPRYSVGSQNVGKDWLYYDYQAMPKLVTTANGTKYWVVSGYGWDGAIWRTYAESDMGLMETGEVVLGTYQLDSTNNIGKFEWVDLDDYLYAPSGSSITILVSNDNGTSWETYSPGTVHTFSTTGNQVQIKIVMTGNGYNSGYFITNKNLTVVLYEDEEQTTPSKVTRHKLLG